ncbi:MAG: aminotransferase class V-fold PLP-dependent enzyme [Nitrososphaerota archaeon]
MDFEKIRSDFPLLSRFTYLDTASSGAISRQVHKSIVDFIDKWLYEGEDWDRVIKDVVEARRIFSSMVGVKGDEVALVPNTSTGLIAAVSSVKWRNESNIVLAEHNFPTNFNVFSSAVRNGLVKEVRVARYIDGRIPIEEYEKLIDENTQIVSVDLVGWLTGYREDLKTITKLAHERGAIVLSDIFHAAGALPLNLRDLDVDIAVCGSYKWLLAPSGAALLYVKKELLDTVLTNCWTGWIGVEDSVVERMINGETRLFERPLPLLYSRPSSSASRYEWGSWAGLTVVGLTESLRFFQKLDMNLSWRRIQKLSSKLVDELVEKDFQIFSPLDEDRRSGIVSLVLRNSYDVAEILSRSKIIVSARPGILRISVDFYNDEEDIEMITQKLQELSKK